jgi:hypothetical protein
MLVVHKSSMSYNVFHPIHGEVCFHHIQLWKAPFLCKFTHKNVKVGPWSLSDVRIQDYKLSYILPRTLTDLSKLSYILPCTLIDLSNFRTFYHVHWQISQTLIYFTTYTDRSVKTFIYFTTYTDICQTLIYFSRTLTDLSDFHIFYHVHWQIYQAFIYFTTYNDWSVSCLCFVFHDLCYLYPLILHWGLFIMKISKMLCISYSFTFNVTGTGRVFVFYTSKFSVHPTKSRSFFLRSSSNYVAIQYY